MIQEFPDRSSWWRARGEGEFPMGATDQSAALGYCPWRSPREVRHQLMGGHRPPPSDAMLEGLEMEADLLAVYVGRTRLDVRSGHMLAVHDRFPWLRCSPDGVVTDGVSSWPCNAKTDRSGLQWPSEGSTVEPANVPHGYGWQVLAEATVLGADRADVVVAVRSGPRWDVRWFRVSCSRAARAAWRRRVRTWRDKHLVRGEPVDGGSGWVEACAAQVHAMERLFVNRRAWRNAKQHVDEAEDPFDKAEAIGARAQHGFWCAHWHDELDRLAGDLTMIAQRVRDEDVGELDFDMLDAGTLVSGLVARKINGRWDVRRRGGEDA